VNNSKKLRYIDFNEVNAVVTKLDEWHLCRWKLLRSWPKIPNWNIWINVPPFKKNARRKSLSVRGLVTLFERGRFRSSSSGFGVYSATAFHIEVSFVQFLDDCIDPIHLLRVQLSFEAFFSLDFEALFREIGTVYLIKSTSISHR